MMLFVIRVSPEFYFDYNSWLWQLFISFVLNLYLFYINKFAIYSYLYQIAHLGDDDDEPEFSSAMPLEEGDTFFFAPRPLKNLVLVDEMESLSPVLSCHIADLGIVYLVCLVST